MVPSCLVAGRDEVDGVIVGELALAGSDVPMENHSTLAQFDSKIFR